MGHSGKNILLEKNARVAVVGAGPSGTFFAKFFLYLAGLKGLKADLTIFDGKDFTQPGPSGCNMCAGVIPKTLVERLHRIDIDLPPSVIQSHIKGYRLKTRVGSVDLFAPPDEKIYTVFRGGGPQFCDLHLNNAGFDNFLLEHVISLGAHLTKTPVRDINLSVDGKVELSYGDKDKPQKDYFDFVAVACGLNTSLLKKLTALGFGYIPPKVVNACQVEVPLPAEYIRERFSGLIHVYKPGISNIRFAAIIPKANHITATIVGDGDVKKADLWQFLMHPSVKSDLPDGWQIPLNYCHCHPRLAMTASRKPFTDRLVIVGDASCTRFYKNGLESAFHTARFAAEAAVKHGIDSDAFKNHYFKRARKYLIKDNIYGRILFKIDKFITSSDIITKTHLEITKKGRPGAPEKLRWILWNLLTGNVPYRRIFFRIFDPRLQASLMAYNIKQLLLLLTFRFYKKRLLAVDKTALGPLKDGSRVAIIGGGPAGTACAIALKNISKSRNMDIGVWLYEKRNYLKDLKSCVGVLSPPIREILKRLGIELPDEMIDQTITDYVLHCGEENIHLTKGKIEAEPTISVNRGDFDFFLLENAKRLGVNIIDEAVNDFNILPDTALVHTSITTRAFDIVVGAFGLDPKMLDKAETRLKGYKRPAILKTILSDIPLSQDEINHKFAGTIHAFLVPELEKVEFGAITPKAGRLSINIAGMRITGDDMDNFLHLDNILSIIGIASSKKEYINGAFPMSQARNFYNDRAVLIGDASGLVRPYKGKGINTAIETGLWAAETMLEDGISAAAFGKFYEKCRALAKDCSYGWRMRVLCRIALKLGWFRPIISRAGWEYNIYTALYDIVSADKSYSEIMKKDVDLKLIMKLAGIVTNNYFKRFFR